MILTFSFSINIRYARTQVIPETTAIDNVLRIFFRDEIFFVLDKRARKKIWFIEGFAD